MNTRRITFALGAASGGMLATAFLSTGIALADATDVDAFGFSPATPLDVVAVSGLPPLEQQVEGFQDFDILTNPEGDGVIHADVSTFTAPGFDNTEILVTGSDGDEPLGTFPGDGSVYDTATFFGLTNDYSDVVTVGATGPTDTITDTLMTPFGSIDLSPLFDSFPTSVDPGDLFTTPVDPGGLADLYSVLGTFFPA